MLKIAMDYKHNWRLQAWRICKTMTGLWRRSPMIQRLQHTQWSRWCSTRTSAGLENPQHLQQPNSNSAQLRKVFVVGQAVTERDEERRRVVSASPAHPLHPGVGQTVAHSPSQAPALRVNAPGLVALGSHHLEVYLLSSLHRVAVALVCK